MKDGLKVFRDQAKVIAEKYQIEYRIAMKAFSLAKKRGHEIDLGIIDEAKSLVIQKRDAKKQVKESALRFGKRLNVYSEHLLEQLIEQNKEIIGLLKK